MVLVSIGYRSLPLPGVPFDQARAIVPNQTGRVPRHLVEAAVAAATQEGAARQTPAQAASAEALQAQSLPLLQHQPQPHLAASGASPCDSAGVYVVGWLKRGPSGIIGTNAVDADETVASIAEVRGTEGRGQAQVWCTIQEHSQN